MQPRLVAISGLLSGSVHRLIDGSLSIGRDDSNALCLKDSHISRRHCRIELASEQYILLDLESRNGTFVNGIPVQRKALAHGDTIRLDQSEFLFLVHPDTEPFIARELETIRLPPVRDTQPTIHPAPFSGVDVGGMARDLGALFKITTLINSIRDLEQLQRELLQLIFEVVPAEAGGVLLLNGSEGRPDTLCIHHRDGGEEPIELERGLIQQALWEHTPILSNPEISNAARPAPSTPSILCVPLIAVERTIGVLYLTSPSETFREEHIFLTESVSRIAAVTLENVLALDALRRENGRLKQELEPPRELVGESRPLTQLQQLLARIAKSDSTVLIRGESGTGKEVVARTIHSHSPRHNRPFIAINCAAIPETLIESELFGSEKGAFTGAVATRKGKFEAAEDGTLLLDEIGELPPSMQAKLLRVLQQREFERIGGAAILPLRARILAATNKDLEKAIKAGEFRQDLYYRLNVVSVSVPPLREHRDDIPLLTLYFAAKYAQRAKRPFKGISRDARALLLAYDWPGNVRELENAIEHAIVLGLTDEILPEDLPAGIVEQQAATLGSRYYDVLNEKKKDIIRASLEQANGSVPEAAHLLGLHPKYLHRLIRNLNVKQPPT
jgi:transcriptional regulator with GAF, ATPase, and Fis domain